MSAFCDVALVLGLTFGGVCTEPVVNEPPTLPADDPSVWALPAPPPPAPVAPAPTMPPIIIKEAKPEPEPAPAPEPVPQPEPVAEAPAPDPYRMALEAAWQHRVSLSSDWGTPAWQSSEMAGGSDHAVLPGMATPSSLDPLDLPVRDDEKADYEGPRRTSTLPVDNSRIITADRYITVILETGINSQVGGDATGTVIVQSARDVYGYHGRNVLIPKGSRLICNYDPPKDMGSSRLSIACERILIAGHRAEIRQLASPISDIQGRQGAAGEVDRRFWERYGTAFMLTGISTAVRYAAATTKSEESDGEVATAAAEKAAEELSTRFGEISASVLEETLSLQPIITIPQGTRLQIRPATDWYIANVE
ncbi:TrbI/VirB10 family protein [Thalassospira sp.]|uniref:TrbI/VirB10 family protein n=1 Tax=Thalassospira sp. TaxID=1912094 RepID=UPI0031201725